MNSVNADLRDKILLRTHYISRFETAQIRMLLDTLQTAHDSIVEKIAKTNGEWTKAWLQGMLDDLDGIYAEAFKSIGGDLTGALKDLSKLEADWAASAMESTIPLSVSITSPSPAQVWAAVTMSPVDRGHLYSEILDGYERATVDKVTAAIRQGVVEGETVSDMIRRVRGTVVQPARWVKDPDTGKKKLRPGVYANGAMETSTRAASTLVRTSVMHVSNVAHSQVYKENADLVDQVQWVATLDTATCPECAALDGTTQDVGTHPTPPLHFNCRCVQVPVVKSWKELGFDLEEVPPGTRASMDGQVPETMTYDAWLKSQPPSVQDEALGPGRAALFRDGMSVTRFVADGRVLTLDELSDE